MKKYYYLLVLLSLFYFYKGQTVLTNGMVYNFSIGDTIKYYTQSMGGPPISYTRTFVQKVTAIDSITYTIKDDHYQPPSCMTCSANVGTSTYTTLITNLNSPATHFVMTNTVCTIERDTVYVDGCGNTVNKKYTEVTPTCFEPDTYTSYLIEGVGLFFEYTYGQDVNHYTNGTILTYYHKVGQVPCNGNGMALGINSVEILKDIVLYPNPVINNKLYISNESEQKLSLEIYSFDGKKVYYTVSNDILVSLNLDLENGIYFMILKTENSEKSTTRKIIIQ